MYVISFFLGSRLNVELEKKYMCVLLVMLISLCPGIGESW